MDRRPSSAPMRPQLPRLAFARLLEERSALVAALQTVTSRTTVPPRDSRAVPADQPRQHRSSLAEADRRRFPRRESGCIVAVHRVDIDKPVSPQQPDWHLHSTQLKGMLLDISLSGVAFLLPVPLAARDAIVLRLSSRYVDRVVDIEAEVLRVTDVSGYSKIVCRFRRNLAFEDVRDFGRAIAGTDLV